MRVVFVNLGCNIYPPIGLCSLSAYLKVHLPGVETVLIDTPPATPLQAIARRIVAASPDLIAITTYTVSFSEVIEVCELLKQIDATVPIVLGGPHITSLPETLPVQADIGVLGEGEETLLELCMALSSAAMTSKNDLRFIRGICFHGESGVVKTQNRSFIASLDLIPPPDLSILNMRWYTASRMYFTMKGNYKGFVLLTSRGCPFSCRFCQASAQWGHCRYHSPERVVAELENLRLRYPQINAINIIDDLFIGDRKRLREIVRLILERNLQLGVVFNVNGHANLVDEEVIRLLKSINVVQIAYGFESGAERILNFLKRGSVTVERNRRAATLTNAAGIGVGGQFMIGCPGETEDELLQTINFIESTPMSHVHISATVPMPGTELWDICRDKGLVSDNMNWHTFDFGNPDNAALLYCNQDCIPYSRFIEIKDCVKQAADKWNPLPSLTANLSYWQLYTPLEFCRRLVAGLNRMFRQYINKVRIKSGRRFLL